MSSKEIKTERKGEGEIMLERKGLKKKKENARGKLRNKEG